MKDLKWKPNSKNLHSVEYLISTITITVEAESDEEAVEKANKILNKFQKNKNAKFRNFECMKYNGLPITIDLLERVYRRP
jgi:hypothetical protein